MTKTLALKINVAALAVVFAAVLSLPLLAVAQGNGNKPEKADIEERVNQRKAEAEARIEEKRAGAELKSAERRQEACERRVEKIESSMERVHGQAERFLGVIDSFYVKVQNFYDSGQLTVTNYDELNEAVMEAQAAAMLEVEALHELEVDIDCEDPDVVISVGTYRSAGTAAKESLKAYRKSLVALISSMRSAAAEGGEGESETEEEGESEQENEEETETSEEETTETDNEEVN